MKFLSTLQRTLSLHFMVVAIIPTLVLGLIAISLLHEHLQSGIYRHNQMLSEQIAVVTEQFLGEVETDLSLAAETLSAGEIVSTAAIDAYLDVFARRFDRIESIYLLDETRYVRNLGLDRLVNPYGEDYHDVDFSRHRIFQQHPVIDRAVWSDTFISLATGEPSVTLALPVGEKILLGNISLQSLGQHFSRFALERNDSCAVLDHDGTLIASSQPALAMQRVNFSDHPSVEAALNGENQTVQHMHGEVAMLESTACIPRTGWVAWVGIDLGAKMAPVRHIRNLLAGIMVVAMFMAAGLALVDARRLMRPLSTLSERAGQIGAGHYDLEVPSSGFAEIDTLAAGLKGVLMAVHAKEESLFSSEQRFRDLVNSIDGVVWELDLRSGKYLFVSERSAAMFGYPPASWLDDPDFWTQHVHGEDVDHVANRGQRRLPLDEGHDLTYRFLTATGDVIWVRDLISVVWEGEEPTRLLGVIIDISERKRFEEELQRYRVHLEELVSQRTRELEAAQNELVQKERLAILGQLTATVSHEIRNPLGTVSNALYLLRETLGQDCLARVERPLALAERSVQRCDGIISELLDFTRRRELHLKIVKIDTWLAEMLDEMVWPAEVDCSWHLESGAIVKVDPEGLRRALVNVVTNALQAMEGSDCRARSLEVRTRQLAERCEIMVTDTGCGIPPEIRERIFEPLFSTKNFGVGLGVPIIRNIMIDHGGGIEFASEVGTGTTVTLWLPLDKDPAVASLA